LSDSFELARAPNIKSIGILHKAMAPAYFTFGSHSAIFVGFTRGVGNAPSPYVNPKYCKIFKLQSGGHPMCWRSLLPRRRECRRIGRIAAIVEYRRFSSQDLNGER
jgi:hypothetical protein